VKDILISLFANLCGVVSSDEFDRFVA